MTASRADYDKMPGHWLLARMGKRVLRPGGRELTEEMLGHVDIGPSTEATAPAPATASTPATQDREAASWARGRAEVQQLITDGELERVRPSVEVAIRLLADVGAHISLASKGLQEDPAAHGRSSLHQAASATGRAPHASNAAETRLPAAASGTPSPPLNGHTPR